MTGELLDISQLETGIINLKIEKTSPYSIVHYAVEAVKMQAENKQIEIVLDEEENLPFINADSEKTSWVLINFLTNGITYSTTESKIIVQVRKSDNQVIFKVIDKGKGIDARYKNRVFDKYFQIPGSSKSGTGLGLAISKEFIEAQKGKIAVESELGFGSTFSIIMNLV
ncbi:signal transduction histidine kinase [Flavobacterium sp. 7E]|uniref:sensor histidine kinase n=1 Tax=Flavobacterium sp. 7E TaxID=2735898 RepID=UPI00352C403B|nr:signal transduction histidine kinase [Flavobacterium sp. 7E]